LAEVAAADGAPGVKLSVIVSAWTGVEPLRSCLGALIPQLDPDCDQVIVARNFGGDLAVTSSAQVTVVDVYRPGATVPELRAAGLAVARGSIVAFTEDHCVCGPSWREAIVRGQALAHDAVGGPVDLAPGGRPLDWAVYFYDYGRFAPPMRTGPIRALSGTNVSYKKTLLDAVHDLLQGRVIEATLAEALRARGSACYLDQDAMVIVRGRGESAGNAIGLAFALARGFAAQRVEGSGAGRRAIFAGGTVLLPFLLFARSLVGPFRTRRHLARYAGALPWLMVLLGAWSAGEFAGYLAGAGASATKWR
jgi:hypothetical protein